MDQKLEQEMNLASAVKKDESQKPAPPKGRNTGMAIVAYIVFFIPLLTEDKNDPFVKFHVKQGMILLVAWFAAGFIAMLPFIGRMIQPLLVLAVFALTITGMYGAYKGEQKPLPLIGKFAASFKI
jgi:uncharacterized membrane protein